PDGLAEVLAGTGDDDQRGGGVGDQPAQPGRERTAQGDGQRPRDVPGRVLRYRAHIDDLPALVLQHTDLAGGQRGERGRGCHDGWTAPVLLGQPQEVAGEGAQAGQQRLDERVLIAGRQQRAGGFLPPDG